MTCAWRGKAASLKVCAAPSSHPPRQGLAQLHARAMWNFPHLTPGKLPPRSPALLPGMCLQDLPWCLPCLHPNMAWTPAHHRGPLEASVPTWVFGVAHEALFNYLNTGPESQSGGGLLGTAPSLCPAPSPWNLKSCVHAHPLPCSSAISPFCTCSWSPACTS